jgi:hypothetical protein
MMIFIVQYSKNPLFYCLLQVLYFTFNYTLYLMKYLMSYIVPIICIQLLVSCNNCNLAWLLGLYIFNVLCLNMFDILFGLLILIDLSTAIGLTPGGSSHLHTNNTQNITINNKTTRITKNNTNKFGRVLAVPSLC